MGVGIHLGPERATLAVTAGTTAQVVPNATGALSTPGAVWLDRRGRIRVGEEAAQRVRAVDGSAVGSVVGRLGMGPDGAHVFGDGTRMEAVELVAEVLRSLRLDYRASTGSDLTRATLAVPDALAVRAEEELRRAAGLAGVEQIEIVPESVAASAGVDREGLGIGGAGSDGAEWLVLIADAAGFSASVIRNGPGGLACVSRTDLPAASGADLDRSLLERLRQSSGASGGLGDIDLQDAAHAALLRRLLREIDAAKRAVWRLGTAQDLFVEVGGEPDDDDVVAVELELTPDLVREVEAEMLGSVTKPCAEFVSSAGLSPESLQAVFVVGTHAEDPYLQSALREEFGLEPVVDPAPATVVARGAAALDAATLTQETPPETAAEVTAPPDTSDPDALPSPAPLAVRPGKSAPIDPDRLLDLRSDARAQRRRLLDLYRRAAAEDAGDLRVDLHGVVDQRLYEQMDGLIQSAVTGGAVDEEAIVEAVRALDAGLDRVEAAELGPENG